jgi:hypothetical protein
LKYITKIKKNEASDQRKRCGKKVRQPANCTNARKATQVTKTRIMTLKSKKKLKQNHMTVKKECKERKEKVVSEGRPQEQKE